MMTKRLWILWFAAAFAAFGQQSLSTTGLVELTISPSGYAAGTQPMRWEARLHNFGSDVPFGAYGLLRLGSAAISGGNNSLIFGGLGGGEADVLSSSQASVPCCLGATGVNGDILLRIQRDTAGVNCSGNACYTFEVCYTLGGYCAYNTLSITTVETNWSIGAIYWLKAGADLAFVRWYSGVVSAGVNNNHALTTPISIAPPTNPSSLLGDWEFEKNLNDSSGHNGAWSVVGGSIQYDPTPLYPPACQPGSQQTFRAGFPVTLNGSGSQPLDGGATLEYQWQLAPQPGAASPHSGSVRWPDTVRWTGAPTVVQPTVTLAQSGSYDFQLTVTDSSGQSSSCVVHDGAVATDNNGVVIYPSGALYSAASKFLGPLIQWGQNPWPWYDTVHKLAADTNMAALGPPAGNGVQQDTLSAPVGTADLSLPVTNCNAWVGANTGVAVVIDSEQMLLGACTDSTHALIWHRGYRGTTPANHNAGVGVNEFWYWDWYDWNQGPGTVTVTSNSAAIAGAGTQFISGGPGQAICNSDGTPIPGLFLVVWHPTDTARTGRIIRYVSSCSSDTSATLSQPWGQGAYPVPAGSGLFYSIGTTFEAYWFNGQGTPWSINYYDNVVAYYLLWLRTGIDTYLIAARQLADTVWFCPLNDQGYAMMYDSREGGFSSRGASMLGLWLRQQDFPPVNMTNGLHRIAESIMIGMTYSAPYVGDARENGYELADLAYTAALDTDPTLYNLSGWLSGYPGDLTRTTYANAALVAISSLTSASGYLNYWNTTQNSTGGWLGLNYNQGDAYNSPWNAGTSVTLTNGSTTVTGINTAWSCSTLANYLPYNLAIWFWHSAPGTWPATNAGGDSTYYTITGCGGATQLTIAPAYAGPSCTNCGYEISLNDGFVGYGQSGYAMSIAARAMHYAANALLPADPADSATTRTVALNASGWVLNRATIPGFPGVAYGVDYVNCPVPISPANMACSKAISVSNVLGFSAEASDGWMSTYQYNQDPATKAAMDAMYNQMWAKPGTCPSGSTICNSSVTSSCALPPCYMTQLDPSADGFMLAPLGTGQPSPPKWFGQYFGFGDYSSWPALRLSAGQAESSQAVYVDFNLKTVAGAVKVGVKATFPNGDTRETECRSAPCAIGVDPRQGTYRLDITYLSSDGSALQTTSAQRSVGF
jgi:hypothetical protein